jgi:hypothetical protein
LLGFNGDFFQFAVAILNLANPVSPSLEQSGARRVPFLVGNAGFIFLQARHFALLRPVNMSRERIPEREQENLSFASTARLGYQPEVGKHFLLRNEQREASLFFAGLSVALALRGGMIC